MGGRPILQTAYKSLFELLVQIIQKTCGELADEYSEHNTNAPSALSEKTRKARHERNVEASGRILTLACNLIMVDLQIEGDVALLHGKAIATTLASLEKVLPPSSSSGVAPVISACLQALALCAINRILRKRTGSVPSGHLLGEDEQMAAMQSLPTFLVDHVLDRCRELLLPEGLPHKEQIFDTLDEGMRHSLALYEASHWQVSNTFHSFAG